MRYYVNYKNSRGNYDDLTIETDSQDREEYLNMAFSETETVNIINALISEMRRTDIAEVLEIFEDDEDPYADYRINPED